MKRITLSREDVCLGWEKIRVIQHMPSAESEGLLMAEIKAASSFMETLRDDSRQFACMPFQHDSLAKGRVKLNLALVLQWAGPELQIQILLRVGWRGEAEVLNAQNKILWFKTVITNNTPSQLSSVLPREECFFFVQLSG